MTIVKESKGASPLIEGDFSSSKELSDDILKEIAKDEEFVDELESILKRCDELSSHMQEKFGNPKKR